MCKERCGAPLEPMRSKGSGLPRLKSGSVGSAGKRSTGPFFVSASPRLALLICPKVVRYLVYSNMVHCVTDHFFVQREVRSTSRTHAKQGFGSPPPEVGLGRFGGKKVHRTFFCVRLTPSRVFVCPKVVRYMLRIFLTTPQIMTRIRNTIFIQAGLGLRLLLPVRT